MIMTREEITQRYRLKIKRTVLEHYGLCCATCGFDDFRALAIDHIDDNGAEERASLGNKNFAGWNFYKYLMQQGFPEGYQTLCSNCNIIKQWNKTH